MWLGNIRKAFLKEMLGPSSPSMMATAAIFRLSPKLFRRSRHFKSHRTIPVQLLTDIERIGPRGTVHHVAPGFMRNNLFPRGKARYLAQEGPLLMSSKVSSSFSRFPSPTVRLSSTPDPYQQSASLDPEEDDEQLANALMALSEITIEKNARPVPYNAESTESLLYRPVNMEMVADHLRETFEIKYLHPPYAVLSVKGDGGSRRRLMSTGSHTVEVKLRNGSVVPLRIRIQRKSYGQIPTEEPQRLPSSSHPQNQSQSSSQ